MASTELTFTDRSAHRAWLQTQATLPLGFRVGSAQFSFVPVEVHKPSQMRLSLIVVDQPTPDFAAVFTRNAFPGAPIVIGRRRLSEPTLGAILVNNKISNVCAPGGVETSEALCRGVGKLLRIPETAVLPSSTGVIGWQLPLAAMIEALPSAVANLSHSSILPAAEGILTTDLYPKIRSTQLEGGTLVGIAKGAGMIEPNLATMLVYLLTDLAVPRDSLRAMLARAVESTFNRMSIDSDTSTSDSVVLVSSGKRPCTDFGLFEARLTRLCADLAEDVVRNGEGVHHVIRVKVVGAPTETVAHQVGKAVVNAPLFKCAVAGNDPNVGRLVQAVGKLMGSQYPELSVANTNLLLGGIPILHHGEFSLDPTKEAALVAHLKAAELYASGKPQDGVFAPTIDFPPHERAVEVEIQLGLGDASCAVLGADLTHEYVSENADYRS